MMKRNASTAAQVDLFAEALAEPEPELVSPVRRRAATSQTWDSPYCSREVEDALRELVPPGAPDFWRSLMAPMRAPDGNLRTYLCLVGETFWHHFVKISGEPGSYTFTWETDIHQPQGQPVTWDAGKRCWVRHEYVQPE